MGIRSKAREAALKALYQIDVTGQPPEISFPRICEHYEINQQAIPFARELVEGVFRERDQIDEQIRQHAENWRIDRMSLIDRNIIRLGVYELCHAPEVPARVIINEAIELAKRYGTEESGAFVNGILDAVHLARTSWRGGEGSEK